MKSQVAIEHIMIVAIVMLILIPGIILYVRYSGQSSDAIAISKAETIAREITKAANEVYNYGQGSQKIVEADFPSQIDYVEFKQNEIIFHIIGSKGEKIEVVSVADLNFKTAATDLGIKDDNKVLTAGRKQLIIKYVPNVDPPEVSVTLRPKCGNDEMELGEACDLNDYSSEEGIQTITDCTIYNEIIYESGDVYCTSLCTINYENCNPVQS